jgi:uncharacterized LabA/DUF88 family protein
MQIVASFIDAAHLNKLCRQWEMPALNIWALILRLSNGCSTHHAYYYDCLPLLGAQATDKDRSYFNRRHRLLTAISHLPQCVVKLGRLTYRGYDAAGRRVFEQKRVDVSLGVDLTAAACKGAITDAAVLTGDEDFIPAIEAARAEGVRVHLFHGPSATHDLIRACDTHVTLTADFLQELALSRHSQRINTTLATTC